MSEILVGEKTVNEMLNGISSFEEKIAEDEKEMCETEKEEKVHVVGGGEDGGLEFS